MPHLVFGSGSQALSLTVEHGGVKDNIRSTAAQDVENQKLLCRTNGKNVADDLEPVDNLDSYSDRGLRRVRNGRRRQPGAATAAVHRATRVGCRSYLVLDAGIFVHGR